MIIIDFRFSQEQSESGIHFLNTSSVLQLLKHSKMSLLLSEVGHLVLYCIVQCRELRPYPEELDNNWFYPASAPALSFHQVCTCFCLISCDCRCNCFVYPRSCSGVFTRLKLRALLPRRRRTTTILLLTTGIMLTHSLGSVGCTFIYAVIRWRFVNQKWQFFCANFSETYAWILCKQADYELQV